MLPGPNERVLLKMFRRVTRFIRQERMLSGRRCIIAVLFFACFWITLESALQTGGGNSQSEYGDTTKLRRPSRSGAKHYDFLTEILESGQLQNRAHTFQPHCHLILILHAFWANKLKFIFMISLWRLEPSYIFQFTSIDYTLLSHIYTSRRQRPSAPAPVRA